MTLIDSLPEIMMESVLELRGALGIPYLNLDIPIKNPVLSRSKAITVQYG